MLVLSRRLAEKIVLPTVPAIVKILAAHNGQVRLGIDAPSCVPILREELTGEEMATAVSPSLKYPVAAGRDQLAHLIYMVERLQLTCEASDPAIRAVLERIEAELYALRDRFGLALDRETAARATEGATVGAGI